MNLPVRTERKLLVKVEIQHNYKFSSTLITGLMSGVQHVVCWYLAGGLFASSLFIGTKGRGKEKFRIPCYFINF